MLWILSLSFLVEVYSHSVGHTFTTFILLWGLSTWEPRHTTMLTENNKSFQASCQLYWPTLWLQLHVLCICVGYFFVHIEYQVNTWHPVYIYIQYALINQIKRIVQFTSEPDLSPLSEFICTVLETIYWPKLCSTSLYDTVGVHVPFHCKAYTVSLLSPVLIQLTLWCLAYENAGIFQWSW